MTVSQPQRFFVLHLANEWPEKSAEVKYEIQIVNESGQAVSWGYAGDHETEIVINGCRIPRAVLEAARRQLMGKGDYVDDTGCSISPVAL